LPFYGQAPGEVFHKIKNEPLAFSYREFERVSDSAKDLISKLVEKDKNKRYNCKQALEHPWFKAAE
jgi:calcium-dependent protein kinase